MVTRLLIILPRVISLDVGCMALYFCLHEILGPVAPIGQEQVRPEAQVYPSWGFGDDWSMTRTATSPSVIAKGLATATRLEPRRKALA
jgi:hypothetical protein